MFKHFGHTILLFLVANAMISSCERNSIDTGKYAIEAIYFSELHNLTSSSSSEAEDDIIGPSELARHMTILEEITKPIDSEIPSNDRDFIDYLMNEEKKPVTWRLLKSVYGRRIHLLKIQFKFEAAMLAIEKRTGSRTASFRNSGDL